MHRTRWKVGAAPALLIWLFQVLPAASFGGTTIARPGCPSSRSRAAARCNELKGHAIAKHNIAVAVDVQSAVRAGGRYNLTLRGKYDSLEEAMAYAKAQRPAPSGSDEKPSSNKSGSLVDGADTAKDGIVAKPAMDDESVAALTRAAKERVAEELAARARGAEAPLRNAPSVAKSSREKTTETSEVADQSKASEPAGLTAAGAEGQSGTTQTETDVSDVVPGGQGEPPSVTVGAAVSTNGESESDAKSSASAAKPSSNSMWSFFGLSRSEPRSSSMTVAKPETIVVVTGATGRVGQLAVRRVLELYDRVLVRAVVNDYSKGVRLLKEEQDMYGVKLEIMAADLTSMRAASKAVAGASAVVFCASGFAQNLSPLRRLANAVRLTLNPSSVADVEGVKDIALALKAAKKIVSSGRKADGADEAQALQPLVPNAPRFVLLSSAAVTRPAWSDEDKARYPMAAEVPIVKLNPLNILTVKAEGEKALRETGLPYAVVRPCGLNDDHPRGRPLFSVGDTAAGRICREDVADVLVRCLGTPEATGKTFEVQTLPGLDKVATSAKSKSGVDQALANLPTDVALSRDPQLLHGIRQATYPVLTQLRPTPLGTTTVKQD